MSMSFDYGKETKSISQVAEAFCKAIDEHKKIHEMSIQDTAQQAIVIKDLNQRYGIERMYEQAKQETPSRIVPVLFSILPPRLISETAEPYDIYDVIIQIFYEGGIKYEEAKNPFSVRMDEYVIEVFNALSQSRHLCELDKVAYKVEHSPEGESSFLAAEIALVIKGKERTL